MFLPLFIVAFWPQRETRRGQQPGGSSKTPGGFRHMTFATNTVSSVNQTRSLRLGWVQ